MGASGVTLGKRYIALVPSVRYEPEYVVVTGGWEVHHDRKLYESCSFARRAADRIGRPAGRVLEVDLDALPDALESPDESAGRHERLALHHWQEFLRLTGRELRMDGPVRWTPDDERELLEIYAVLEAAASEEASSFGGSWIAEFGQAVDRMQALLMRLGLIGEATAKRLHERRGGA